MTYLREVNLSKQIEVQPFKIALTQLPKHNLVDLKNLEDIAIDEFAIFLCYLPPSIIWLKWHSWNSNFRVTESAFDQLKVIIHNLTILGHLQITLSLFFCLYMKVIVKFLEFYFRNIMEIGGLLDIMIFLSYLVAKQLHLILGSTFHLMVPHVI